MKPAQRSDVRDVISGSLTASTNRLREYHPHLLGSDVEAVHRARVATRRYRTILSIFRRGIDRDWADGLRKEIREFARTLGAVRDADVLSARLQSRLAALGPAHREAGRLLASRAAAQRSQARSRLAEELADPSHEGLIRAMERSAGEPKMAEGYESLAPNDFAARAWRKLDRGVKRLDAKPSPQDLHRTRILAKRFRYTCEALAPVAGQDAKRAAKAATNLQDVLGELQDATVARGWLRRAAEADPASKEVAEVLIQLERAASLDVIRTWKDTWKALDRKKHRTWIDKKADRDG